LWGCRGLLFDFFNPIYVDIRALGSLEAAKDKERLWLNLKQASE
jgi:hypothetical protein